MTTKICTKCGLDKPLTDYTRSNAGKYGRRSACKACLKKQKQQWYLRNPDKVRDRKHRERYRFSGYSETFSAQGGVCLICRKPETKSHRSDKPNNLSVDHCHDTGTVRGLLCNGCNACIGLSGENPSLLRSQADYLEKWNQEIALRFYLMPLEQQPE